VRHWEIWLSIVCPVYYCRDVSLTRIHTADNKLLIVKLGGLEPLIRQMLSPNVEVQCNAVGCVTNLATHGASSLSPPLNHLLTCFQDDNKTKIAKSGALVPLTRLARSKDMRVQRNATGALLNMTHSGNKNVFLFRPCIQLMFNLQTRIGSSWSMRALSRCWSVSSTHLTPMCNIIVPLL